MVLMRVEGSRSSSPLACALDSFLKNFWACVLSIYHASHTAGQPILNKKISKMSRGILKHLTLYLASLGNLSSERSDSVWGFIDSPSALKLVKASVRQRARMKNIDDEWLRLRIIERTAVTGQTKREITHRCVVKINKWMPPRNSGGVP